MYTQLLIFFRHTFPLLVWFSFVPSIITAADRYPSRSGEKPATEVKSAARMSWESLMKQGATSLPSAVGEAIHETMASHQLRGAYLASEATSVGAIVSTAAQSDRDTAAGLFNYLDTRGNYVKNLTLQGLAVLPVGTKAAISGNADSLEIGILKAVFFPTYAELTVFVRMIIPSPDPHSTIKKRELFFGADHVRFTRDGGLTGDFSLVLLGDFVVPMGNMTLRIKGGLDKHTGITQNLTYATVNCDKLVGLGVAGEVLFPLSMLVPINPTDGSVQPGQVRGDFRIDAPDFNDLLAGVTMTPFAVTGYEKFGFVLNNAMLDLSDKRNAPGVVFPSGYFDALSNSTPDGDSTGEGINTWRGVYIQQFMVLLPQEFKEKQNPGVRLQIQATNLLFDRNGVSGQVGMHRTGNPYELTASGWALSLTDFELGFEKNKLVGGRFGGFLRLPVAPTTPIRYDGIIDRQADYTLSLANVSTLSMPLWRATAQLAPNSRVELSVINGEFKPKALLHGQLGIFTNMKGDSASQGNAKVAFEGIVFEGLKLQTEQPYIQAAYFGYEKDMKLANFPVTVHRVGAVFAGDSVGLRFDMRVNLMEETFSGETDFTIVGSFSQINGIHEWQFRRVTFNSICVKGTFSSFQLNGCVFFRENHPVYGDGFAGNVALTINEPSKVRVDIEAMFGATTFRYWFVAGGATVPGIPIAGPLKINYMYAALYRHMKAKNVAGLVVYEPNESMGTGFKAVVGLEAVSKKTFEGSAGFEMAFNKNGGINSLGFYGEGVLAGGFKTLQNQAAKYRTLVQNSEAAPEKETISQEDLDRKALAEYKARKDITIGPVAGRLVMLFDFANRTLHGNAQAYVDIGGVVRGSNSGGLAGDVVFHFDPQEWYVHAG
jgi:hypothetical protein